MTTVIDRSPCVKSVVAVLNEHGISHTVEMGGKHPHIDFTVNGQQKRYFTSATPSDRRAPLNHAADVRRMIKDAEAGLVGIIAPTLQERDGRIQADSRQVADSFGKRHDNVLRDIDKILKNLDSSNLRNTMFSPSMEPDESGIQRRIYTMTRNGFSLLAMGFSGKKALEFKLAFLDAFTAMENALSMDQAPVAADGRLRRLESEFEALTDIVLSLPAADPTPRRNRPFVRPSVLRRKGITRRDYLRGAL